MCIFSAFDSSVLEFHGQICEKDESKSRDGMRACVRGVASVCVCVCVCVCVSLEHEFRRMIIFIFIFIFIFRFFFYGMLPSRPFVTEKKESEAAMALPDLASLSSPNVA